MSERIINEIKNKLEAFITLLNSDNPISGTRWSVSFCVKQEIKAIQELLDNNYNLVLISHVINSFSPRKVQYRTLQTALRKANRHDNNSTLNKNDIKQDITLSQNRFHEIAEKSEKLKNQSKSSHKPAKY